MSYSNNMAAYDGIMSAFFAIYAVILVVSFIVSIVLIISMWKIFVKADKPGWAAIVPFYNFWVLSDIVANNNIMWFIFLFIPGLSAVSILVLYFGLAKSFGKGTGFAIFTLLFPFIAAPILAFGSAEYEDKGL